MNPSLARQCAAVTLGLGLSFLNLPIQPVAAQPQNACQSWFRLVQTRDGDPVLLRANPNGAVIGRVNNGHEVLFNGGDRTGAWANITLKGGKTGWVADRFLGRHPADTAQFTGQYRIKTLDGDSVALRANAGLRGKAIASLKPGDLVTQVKTVGEWIQVKTSTGQLGFISSQYLVCR
ncbi:MAG: SH3 domain-containing protein [Synechococcales cyanobacterium RU_4_20]|nr:SH3 domain-containing protein [Synechococcales cyanobacterium RU_4_20]NJR68361.1 SH3 domain-containing protein [Synechococcales cyanobacterium CRU_2_2]